MLCARRPPLSGARAARRHCAPLARVASPSPSPLALILTLILTLTPTPGSALVCALVATASATTELTMDNFDELVLKSGKAAFVKFLAPW